MKTLECKRLHWHVSLLFCLSELGYASLEVIRVASREGRAASQWSRRGEPASRWELPTLLLLLFLSTECVKAQDNFDVQVYRSRNLAPKTTAVEVLSNITADGTKALSETVYPATQLYPTDDALHETVEITQGLTSWSEMGFYVLTSASSGHGWQWVGDDLRTQLQAPDGWHWPVGASLSVELGYQRPPFANNTWTMRLRPIFDRRFGRYYLAVNPAFDWSLHGQNSGQGAGFAPSVKFSYAFNKFISSGLEYYGNYGSVQDIAGFHHQQQEFFPAVDLNVSSEWKINLGVGIGVTTVTDDWIWKANISRRFDWGRRPASTP